MVLFVLNFNLTMTTVAAGMESDSDSDCDIVFSSNIKDDSKDTKTYNYRPSNPPLKNFSNRNLSTLQDSGNEVKADKTDMIPTPVVRRMRRNHNANTAYNRQRALKNKALVFDDLRYAILQGNLDATKNLYESNDIDVDTILKSGWTGLMYACSVGHFEVVDYLLQKKANPNFHQDMFTPLMAVCISKKSEEDLFKCCTLLLKYKANVNGHDRHRNTPLIFAAREGHTQIVRLLLEHNSDPDASDNRGYTALAWAAYFAHGQVVRVLLEKGADRKKVNNMGQSPADIAYDCGHDEVGSLLQKVHISDNEESSEAQNSCTTSGSNKIIPNLKIVSNSENSKKFVKVGELDLFLIGIGCQNLIEKFNQHHLTFHDLLIMNEEELEKVGIFQVGLRQKILEACKSVHKKEWENSSLPNLKKNQYISCPDAVGMVANISKHLKYISTSVIYIRQQIQSQPRILELSRESANVHNLMDELEDSLKNIHTLKDEMRFLKMHLVKIQDKPEYSSSDQIIEIVSKDKSHKIFTALGIATVSSLIFAGIWWKYPGILNSQPSISIRIPFLK